MWAHVSGSLLLTSGGFWIRPSPVVISRGNYPDSSCFAFCHVARLLWGWPGYRALLEAISLHWTLIVRNRLLSALWKGDGAQTGRGAGSCRSHNQNDTRISPDGHVWLQCAPRVRACSSEYGNMLCETTCWKTPYIVYCFRDWRGCTHRN